MAQAEGESSSEGLVKHGDGNNDEGDGNATLHDSVRLHVRSVQQDDG